MRELAIAFYVGVPVFLGLLLGWTGAGEFGGQLSRPVAIAYWITGTLLLRVALEVSIRLVALLAPKKKTPLVVLCVLSVPVHMIFVPPLYTVWQSIFIGYLPVGAEVQLPSPWYDSFSAFVFSLGSFTMVMVEWTLTNLLFDRVLGFPRFRETTGYTPREQNQVLSGKTAVEAKETEPPKFMRRANSGIGTEIIALAAEDHYVRVHTPLGNDLIFCRFGDAVSEMPKDVGMQIHRSYWVRTSAITNFWKEGNLYRIEAGDGLSMPVSKRFLGLLKANGVEPEAKT